MKTNVYLFALLLPLSAAAQKFEIHTAHVVTNDLVYDSITNKIYASIPAANGPNGNSLGVFSLSDLDLEQTVFIGSDPTVLAIADDGSCIYSGFDGSNTVLKINLPLLDAETPFSLGSHYHFGPLYAEDLEIMPGNPDVVVISTLRKGVSPRHGGVVVYDKGIPRTAKTQDHTGSNRIEFSGDPAWMFGYCNESTEFGLRRLKIDSSGIYEVGVFQNQISGFAQDFIYHDNRLYAGNGKCIDVENAPYVAGQFFTGYFYSGKSAYDSQTDKVAYATSGYQGEVSLKLYDPKTFLPVDSIFFPDSEGPVKSLVNCGANCYVLSTFDNRVILVKPSVVSVPENDLKVQIYPNPVQSEFIITESERFSRIRITDLQGKEVFSSTANIGRVNVSSLAAGLYILEVYQSDNSVSALKLLKQDAF